MIRIRSALFHVMLVLSQILIPWVHAHTGTEPAGAGVLHLPGLEWMSARSDDAGITGQPVFQANDVIIGVQAGIEHVEKAWTDPADHETAVLLTGVYPVDRAIRPRRILPDPLATDRRRLFFLAGAPARASPSEWPL